MSNPTKPMITDIFVAGARKGWVIATTSTLPNVLMAFVIIKVLQITGLLDLLGKVCEPIMALVGLPGEAAAVLISSLMSMGGAIGVAVGLFQSGHLNGEHLAILAPAIYLMGSLVQYVGRVLGVVGTKATRIPLMLLIAVINAFVGMFLMRIIINL